jgi:hypothetical protein
MLGAVATAGKSNRPSRTWLLLYWCITRQQQHVTGGSQQRDERNIVHSMAVTAGRQVRRSDTAGCQLQRSELSNPAEPVLHDMPVLGYSLTQLCAR